MRPAAPDVPPQLGATVTASGVDFAVYAGHADAVEICLFDAEDRTGAGETRVELLDRAHGTWFGSVAGIRAGQRYGIRVHGPWRPADKLRHNANKLLLDPYAKAVVGDVIYRPEVYGHHVNDHLYGDPEVMDSRDSAAFVPRGVVVDNGFDWGDDRPPAVRWADTVVYEAHVRNVTMTHPDIPAELRGTYAGMAHPAVIAYLQRIGVTTLELLPVHAFVSEPALLRRGLVNHWGYNTLGFFAAHAPYAASLDPLGALAEFKGMVKLLHRAGIEVILDVVYNHTCEQGRDGPTLSWRGLDNRAYYRLDERGRDIDVTGCGNTLDLRHPMVCRQVLDSLRYWVEECHVDGFRFDLAVALARGRSDDYDRDHAFLVALRTDPVVRRVKLIAEPWDLGVHGWRTGQFPPPFGEWNDRFRDTMRNFWLQDVARAVHGQPGHGIKDLGTRLAGSQDLFDIHDRGPIASVNFVAAHDGFTMADLTAYNQKHNSANGENNSDGTHDSRSWNHGVEGRSVDSDIAAARRRSMRNMMGILLLSTGVPMINGGDEFGRSQWGNNNAYCQDNELSWYDWNLAPWQRQMLDTTAFLAQLRASHPVLRQRRFFGGRPVGDDGRMDLTWFGSDGSQLADWEWNDPFARTVSMLLDGSHVEGDSLLVVLHGGGFPTRVTLPDAPGTTTYRMLWDSSLEKPRKEVRRSDKAGSTVDLGAWSLRVYAVT